MKKPKAGSYCRTALDTYFQGFLSFTCATLKVNYPKKVTAQPTPKALVNCKEQASFAVFLNMNFDTKHLTAES